MKHSTTQLFRLFYKGIRKMIVCETSAYNTAVGLIMHAMHSSQMHASKMHASATAGFGFASEQIFMWLPSVWEFVCRVYLCIYKKNIYIFYQLSNTSTSFA